VRMDCLGRGSKVMTPSGPVLLPPGREELVGDGVSVSGVEVDDSLTESPPAESVSEGDPGESYP